MPKEYFPFQFVSVQCDLHHGHSCIETMCRVAIPMANRVRQAWIKEGKLSGFNERDAWPTGFQFRGIDDGMGFDFIAFS